MFGLRYLWESKNSVETFSFVASFDVFVEQSKESGIEICLKKLNISM